jgi:hypothetical protein
MKKIIFLSLISMIIMSFCQNENKKTLTESQLKFIKEKYKWNSEDLLIINFVQPNKNCFYENNGNLENSIKWHQKFYSKINLNNVLNISVYSDKISARKIIDSETKFEDYDDFLLRNFFSLKKECYGVLVVNSKGEYEIQEGEYSEKQVENFIKTLKKPNAQ